MKPDVRVYLAGKIAKNDWRHELFPGLRHAAQGGCGDAGVLDTSARLRRDRFVYGGPFFISCDHGCSHGPGAHGVGSHEEMERSEASLWRRGAVQRCQDWISRCEAMFVWLDDASAYGTIAEIGFASALGLEVWVFGPRGWFPGKSDMWLPLTMAYHAMEVDCLADAWGWFRSNCLLNPYGPEPSHADMVIAARGSRTIAAEMREESLQKERPGGNGKGGRPGITGRGGYIYVLLAENGLYKIGRATNLDQRIEKLGIQVPMEIRLVHATRVNDAPKTEALLHAKFREQRVRGEWFKLSESDLNWIRLCPGW